MRPTIGVEFCITGHDMRPAEITDRIDLAPTSTWLEGDSIQGTKLRYKHDGWCLSLANKKESMDLEEGIGDLLHVLLPKAERINQVRSEHHLDCELSCVIYMSDEVPAMNLSKETVAALSQLGAAVDIDVILAE